MGVSSTIAAVSRGTRPGGDGTRELTHRRIGGTRTPCQHVPHALADKLCTRRPDSHTAKLNRSRSTRNLAVPEVVSLSDRIRRSARARHIEPARQAGMKTVTIRAGDLGRDMGLNNRMAAVCSAVGSKQFLREAGLRLVERVGPRQSTTTEFRFEILDRSADESIRASTKRVSAPSGSTRIVSKQQSPPDMGDGRRLFLVSCVKTKLPTRAPAKDLYVSAWFRKARACVESTGCPWGILSAEHGLLHPAEEIRPYERTLNAMPVAERRAWAHKVLESMAPFLEGIETVVFFAGQRYREFLEPGLRDRGVAVSVPMLGLSQGRQLAWLDGCLHG